MVKALFTHWEVMSYHLSFICLNQGVNKDVAGEEQVLSNGKVMCRLCFSGENERSVRARKMLSCKTCNKKYHRSCLKTWAHDRGTICFC